MLYYSFDILGLGCEESLNKDRRADMIVSRTSGKSGQYVLKTEISFIIWLSG